MTLELDVDEQTEERIEELREKTQQNVDLQVTFAVEDLIQNKYQELRAAEKQQAAQQQGNVAVQQ